MENFKLPSPITKLNSEFLKQKGISLCLKRDDLIHQEISGNKWRKLKFNIGAAKEQDLKTVLTFGGAYSNHIAATAAAGNQLGIKTIGIIRGKEGFKNETLKLARSNGMHLKFVSRQDYKLKTERSFIENLKKEFGSFYLIPEGGANELGVKGCEEILDEQSRDFDYVICSAGTGTTASGICRSLKIQKMLVFPALKGASFILDEMRQYCNSENIGKLDLQLDYHFGGYGKVKPELIEFYKQFKTEYNVELDLVYTSKMMYGLFDLISKDYFKSSSKILAIHTGGVQGNKGFLG